MDCCLRFRKCFWQDSGIQGTWTNALREVKPNNDVYVEDIYLYDYCTIMKAICEYVCACGDFFPNS